MIIQSDNAIFMTILIKYHPIPNIIIYPPPSNNLSPTTGTSLYIKPPVIIKDTPPPNNVVINVLPNDIFTLFILVHPLVQQIISLNLYRKKSNNKYFARDIIVNYMLSSIGGRESDINNLSSILVPPFSFLATTSSPPLVNQPICSNPFKPTTQLTETEIIKTK